MVLAVIAIIVWVVRQSEVPAPEEVVEEKAKSVSPESRNNEVIDWVTADSVVAEEPVADTLE